MPIVEIEGIGRVEIEGEVTPERVEEVTAELRPNLLSKIGKNFEQSLRDMHTEVLSPVASGLSNAALGIPRQFIKFAEKEGIPLSGLPGSNVSVNVKAPRGTEEAIFPEQTSAKGKALRAVADLRGLIKGGAAKIGKEAAQKVFPQQGIGLSSQAGKIRQAVQARNMANIGRGAIEGAAIGGLQLTNTDGSVSDIAKQQLKQAAGGAFIGAGVGSFAGTGGASGTAKQFKQSFKKLHQTKKRSPLIRLTEKQKSARQRTSLAKKDISKQRKQLGKERQESLEQLKAESKNQIDDATNGINQNINVLKQRLIKEAEKGTLKVQDNLRDFARSTSRAYGEQLDDIAVSVSKSGNSITIAQTDDVLTNTINELDEMQIDSGRARSLINNLHKKYGRKMIGGSGGKTSTKMKPNDDDIVDAVSMVNDFKQVGKSLSKGAKSGSRLKDEDVALMVLRKNYGKLLDDASDGAFSELQATYGKSADAVKKAYRTFQPKQAEQGGTAGIRLIKKAGEGKTLSPEDKFIEFLEEGTTIGKTKVSGVGDVTSEVRKISNEINKLDDLIVLKKTSNKEALRTKRQELVNAFDNKMSQLSKKQDALEGNLLNELNRIDDRRKIIQDIMANAKSEQTQPLKRIVRNLPERATEAVAIATMFKLLNVLGEKE